MIHYVHGSLLVIFGFLNNGTKGKTFDETCLMSSINNGFLDHLLMGPSPPQGVPLHPSGIKPSSR